jgi:hypothetical protein
MFSTEKCISMRCKKSHCILLLIVVATLSLTFIRQDNTDAPQLMLTMQTVPLSEHFSQTSSPELRAKEISELPNGPAGLHGSFSAADAEAFFVPLSRRPKRNALKKIFDTITISCNADSSTDFDQTLATSLGRTRLLASLQGCAKIIGSERETVGGWLRKNAPSWYVSAEADGAFIVKRRSKVFTFCIGGGSDGRANYVEATWGQRTPIQWYMDKWSDELRPIVDLHPNYVKDPFNLLTFKISRIWQRVHSDFGAGDYDWYIRLWDDNYFLEENVYNVLGRMDLTRPLMVGKIGWRNMGKSAVYPFAGGGAGWFLNKKGLSLVGPSIPEAEKWFFNFRARKDIFLKHHIHDEDVFLTAWFHLLNISFVNAPGLEHVSPGNEQKQRCMADDVLYRLRWKDDESIYFDYPAHEEQFRIEEAWYAYTKPIVWHYMSPRRLLRLESLLYPQRRDEFKRDDPPRTNADIAKKNRQCYPGIPDPPPPRGNSMFERPLPDPQ